METTMKRISVLLVCLLANAHAVAGWSLLQETGDGILYVDREAAEKTAAGWVLDSSQDFHKVQLHEGKEYLSARARYELDCTARKIRQLRVEIYPENMAGGDLVHTDDRAQAWQSLPPGSRDEAIWKSMCP
jgi:hypothetical protein